MRHLSQQFEANNSRVTPQRTRKHCSLRAVLLAVAAFTLALPACSATHSMQADSAETVGCALAITSQATADVQARVYAMEPHQAQDLARTWNEWGHGVHDIVPLNANQLSELLPRLDAGELVSVPMAQISPGQVAALPTGETGDKGQPSSRVSVTPEWFGGGWVANVVFEEIATTWDGKRMVRRSETRAPLSGPVAILSAETGTVVVVGIGTSPASFPHDRKAVELAQR